MSQQQGNRWLSERSAVDVYQNINLKKTLLFCCTFCLMSFIAFFGNSSSHTILNGTLCVTAGSIYIWWPNPSVCPSRKSNSYEVFHLDRAVTHDPECSWGLFSPQGTQLHKHWLEVVAHLSQCWRRAMPTSLSLLAFAFYTVRNTLHTSLAGFNTDSGSNL